MSGIRPTHIIGFVTISHRWPFSIHCLVGNLRLASSSIMFLLQTTQGHIHYLLGIMEVYGSLLDIHNYERALLETDTC